MCIMSLTFPALDLEWKKCKSYYTRHTGRQVIHNLHRFIDFNKLKNDQMWSMEILKLC